MKFKAILFDINGTLIDIWTDENREEVYRVPARLLSMYGFPISADDFRTRFYELMKEQRRNRSHEHPEFDVIGIFRTLLGERAPAAARPPLTKFQRAQLPEFLARAFRAASMLKLALYPGVRPVLEELQKNYALAVVSDAQSIWAEAELRQLDLCRYFPVRVISGDFGFRKPSPELFASALAQLKTAPADALYVGNDTYRDVFGAKQAGMKMVFFQSDQGDQRPHGAEPDYVIHSFEELPTAIRFLEERKI